jgi:hypothetical protein
MVSDTNNIEDRTVSLPGYYVTATFLASPPSAGTTALTERNVQIQNGVSSPRLASRYSIASQPPKPRLIATSRTGEYSKCGAVNRHSATAPTRPG